MFFFLQKNVFNFNFFNYIWEKVQKKKIKILITQKAQVAQILYQWHLFHLKSVLLVHIEEQLLNLQTKKKIHQLVHVAVHVAVHVVHVVIFLNIKLFNFTLIHNMNIIFHHH